MIGPIDVLVTALVLFLLAVNAAPMLVMRLLSHLLGTSAPRIKPARAPKCSQCLFWPVDQFMTLSDNERLFGQSKTCFGFLVALITGALMASILDWPIWVSVSLAMVAMIGDLCSSFIKRRRHLIPGAKIAGLDQLPEVLLPASLALWLLPMNFWQFLVVVFGFIGGHILLIEIIDWLKKNPSGQKIRLWINNPRQWWRCIRARISGHQ